MAVASHFWECGRQACTADAAFIGKFPFASLCLLHFRPIKKKGWMSVKQQVIKSWLFCWYGVMSVFRTYFNDWLAAWWTHNKQKVNCGTLFVTMLQTKNLLIKTRYISHLPFASKFGLAFLIEEEPCVTVAPSVPFHDFLPVANKMSRMLDQHFCQKTHAIFSAFNRSSVSSNGSHLV